MSEKELLTKEDFLSLKQNDVIRVKTGLYKTELSRLNELCHKIFESKADIHANNDILIVDSLCEYYVKNGTSGYYAMKITSESEKIRSPKDTIIILIDTNMKKHFYKIKDLVQSAIYWNGRLFKQES